MRNINTFEILAIIIGIISLIVSFLKLISSIKRDKEISNLIAKKEIIQEINKYIRIRNANNKNPKRVISEKEFNIILNEINLLTKQLEQKEKKLFFETLDLKNEKNKRNYLKKLIYESESEKNENFEIQKT